MTTTDPGALEGLTVERVPLHELVQDPQNPKTHSERNYRAIQASLRDHGQVAPLVVQASTSVIIAGNATALSMAAEGMTHADVVLLDVDDAERRRLAVRLNRTSELGGWDAEVVADVLAEWGDDYGELWDAGEAAELFEVEGGGEGGGGAGPSEDAPAPLLPSPEDVDSEPGQVYQLGPHRLVCGDCRDAATVERLMDGASVNVGFTSPPYASQRAYDENSGFRPIPPDEFVGWFDAVQVNVLEHLVDGGSWFVNIKEHCEKGQRHLYVKDLAIAHVRQWGWRLVDEFCWTRPNPPGRWPDRFKNGFEPVFHFANGKIQKFNPEAVGHESENIPVKSSLVGAIKHTVNADYWNLSSKTVAGVALPSNVVSVSGVQAGTGHTAAFPVGLPEFFILAFTDRGDVVYEPFGGSGTTLIAAAKNDRRCMVVELSPAYCDVIRRRWTRWARENGHDPGPGALEPEK